jgi:replicative DNA helicase
MIVPYEVGGYWVGIQTEPKAPALLYIRPKAGTPGIWNASALWTSDGDPVIMAPDILDALAVSSTGYDAMTMDAGASGLLADTMKARPPSGPLVFIPPTKDPRDIENMGQITEALESLGAPVVCYDLSNHEGDYTGAMETLKTEGADALRVVLNDLREWAVNDSKGEKARYLQESTGAHLGTFRAMIGERTGKESVSTGLRALDNLLDGGLFPGLYILGAVSSLGKTTFTLQIADSIAEQGRDVLFFSLEQSKDELIAKSLARLTASIPTINDYPLTSRQILYKMNDWIGTQEETTLSGAMDQYAHYIGPHMFIIENDTRPLMKKDKDGNLEIMKDAQDVPIMTVDRIGLDTIRDRIRDHIRIMGKDRAPVVFIDYLQILRPEDSTGRKSDKQNLDMITSELRRISKAHQVPIFAISSLNRDAYNQPISMASFKESGAIEYSSDVLIGINPVGLKVGDSDKTKGANKEVFEELRKKELRPQEVVILKNRIGELGTVPMTLNAPYGLYTEGSLKEGDDIPTI